MKYILALDISSTKSGWALMSLDKKLIDYGCFESKGSHLSQRLTELKKYLLELTLPKEYEIIVYCEKPMEGGRFASALKCCWGAHGVVIGTINAPINFVIPRKWREIVFGDNYNTHQKRDALKTMSIKFVKDKYNVETKNDDIADAICLARYGAIVE